MKFDIVYSVQYRTTVEVPDDTAEAEREKYMEDAIAGIDIPENDASKYSQNSFDLVGCVSELQRDYHFSSCPDCEELIPDTLFFGEACKNCGHVFNKYQPVDNK